MTPDKINLIWTRKFSSDIDKGKGEEISLFNKFTIICIDCDSRYVNTGNFYASLGG